MVKVVVEGNFSATVLAMACNTLSWRCICIGLRPLCSCSECGSGFALSTERAGVIWFLLPEVEFGVVG